jgi:hypothetical protein
MKVIFIHPNLFNIPTIGFNGPFPEEFKAEFRPDIEDMFEKTVLKPIYRVLNAMNMEIKNPLAQETIDLLELLS